MKKNYLFLTAIVLAAIATWSFIPKKQPSNPGKDAILMEMISFVIKNAHYAPKDINDELSEKIFDKYLNGIDPNKRFLTQSEVDQLSMYKTLIDNEIQRKSFKFFDASYDIIIKKINASKDIYTEILSQPFDFTIDESINIDYEKAPYAKDEAELKERWRKQLKLSVLSSLEDKIKLQEGKNVDEEEELDEPNLVATPTVKKKKEEKPVEKKSFEELEKEARETTLKSLNDYFEVMLDFSREEWMAIYINAILEEIDPHTNYFSPETKEKFDESMAGSMEGIGATLRKKNDYIEITEIIVGGPAWKQKELENGDLIMKVAQGEGEAVDIAGMRLEKVIKLIKGKKGTKVRLTVKKVDGTITEISIVRDKFEIEETFAKSTIITSDGKKYGLIQLPKFYEDFGDKSNRNAFTDMKKEVEYLKNQKVEGIIVDLRNNGGGSLRTVVDMMGLFIKQGPVVQVRSKSGVRNVLSDRAQDVFWDGPLTVLVNSYSASASEIFAAAIQDYNRGLVIGSKQTFGKGTVQNLFDLNDLLNIKNSDFGSLKFTSQKFYRVNGGSTQLKGVESDIVLPDHLSYIPSGERENKTAMPWDKIEKVEYSMLKNNFEKVKKWSKERVSKNTQFNLINENAKWISSRKDDNDFSLELNSFRKKSAEIEENAKKFKAIKKYKNNLTFDSYPEELKLMEKDSILKNKRKRWHETLSHDVYVEEAVNVLRDIKKNS